ncbi:MAG: ATP-binding cassette domain-containing protein [archaeon]
MKSIIIKNVSKKFYIGTKSSRILGKEQKKEFLALKNINLELKTGEKIGIIGKNGAGKSTLLRIIAGIYQKDSGTLETNGKLISVLGLNIGLQERLSVKDNIFLFCTLYKLTKNQINQKLKTILKFAELERYENTKLYQLSDGMKVRLISAISLHANSDIILLDDVDMILDKKFVQKATKKHIELSRKGTTVIIVTHNLDLLKHCHKVLWMDNGEIKAIGENKEIVKSYLKDIKKNS